MRTWHKINFYKRLFLVFIALNVFCVSAGLIVGWSHWSSKIKWQQEQTQVVSHLEKLQGAKNLIFSMLQSNKNDTHLTKKSSNYEEQLFIRWRNWEQLQTELKALNEPEWVTSLAQSMNIVKGPTEANLENVFQHLSNLQTQGHAKMNNIGQKLMAVTEQMVWVAVLTLIFGVLLPGLLFYLTGRALNLARKELQVQIRGWVDEWVKQSKLVGNDPFKSVDFWVKMALLAVEGVAQYGHHPMLDISADISQLIRTEMNKSQRHSAEKAA